MEFTSGVSRYDMNYNLNAIGEYNKFLQNNNSFQFDDSAPTEFEKALEDAAKSAPLKDKHDPLGMGSFMDNIGFSFGNRWRSG